MHSHTSPESVESQHTKGLGLLPYVIPSCPLFKWAQHTFVLIGKMAMFFKKRPPLETPMDQFLHRDELNQDERAVLDVYLTGVSHALSGVNAVRTSNGLDPVFSQTPDQSLNAADMELLVEEFLKQRPDMQNQSLGLCAVMAVMQSSGSA